MERTRRSISIVGRLLLNVVDYKNGHGPFLFDQFETQLFFDGLENRGAANGFRGCASVATAARGCGNGPTANHGGELRGRDEGEGQA